MISHALKQDIAHFRKLNKKRKMHDRAGTPYDGFNLTTINDLSRRIARQNPKWHHTEFRND